MRVRLKGIYANHRKRADGTLVTYYFLRGVGAIKPLPGDEDASFHPGSPAFMRAYQATIDAPKKLRHHGTMKALCDDYQKSGAWVKLAPRTKVDYLAHIAKIEKAFGVYPIDVLEDPKIRVRFLDWRDGLAKSSPRQADSAMAVLRVILEWARDRGLLSHNHALRPKKLYKADRSDKLWLPPHLDSFRAVASDEMRLALELALATGQRQGDLLKLAWSAYDGQRIRFRQGKRHRLVDMRLPADTKALLDKTPKRALTILTSPTGKPWGKVNFQHKWRAATLAAGLDGLHFHDLRGTACTRLSEAGATPQEIAAVLGWTVKTVNAMLDTYQAMTAALSDSAIAKLEARKG